MGSLGIVEMVVLLLLGPIVYIGSLIWIYRDAERRGSHGMLTTLLVAVAAWPLGLIVWPFIRSKTKN
ncbi:MAG TPA: hypothetical protein DCY57_11795 [Bacteroidetes bacterium]|nr:hypothetical protein [Bacteroidota bacterium]